MTESGEMKAKVILYLAWSFLAFHVGHRLAVPDHGGRHGKPMPYKILACAIRTRPEYSYHEEHEGKQFPGLGDFDPGFTSWTSWSSW